MAGAKPLGLGGLGIGGLTGHGVDTPVARGRAPVDVENGLGHFQRVESASEAAVSSVMARSSSTFGSSGHTPCSCSSAKRSHSTGPPAASQESTPTKRAVGAPAGTRSSVSMRLTCHAEGR